MDEMTLEEAIQKVTELEAALKASEEKATELELKNEELAETVKALEEANAELNKQLGTAAATAVTGHPTFERGGKTYKVVYPTVRLEDSSVVTATEIAQNSKIHDHLIDIGSGAIELVS